MQLKKLKKANSEKILLFVINQPLTPFTYKRLGVDTMYKDWKIIYWNVLPFLNKKLANVYLKKGNKVKKNRNYININSLIDLINEYKKMPNRFFYSCWFKNSILISLLDRILKFSGGTKMSLIGDGFPAVKMNYFDVAKNLIIYDKIYLLKKSYHAFFNKIKIYLNENILQPNSDIFFVPNYSNYLIFKKKFKDKKIFKIDGYDYGIFNRSKRKKSKIKNKAVFIDQVYEKPFDIQLGSYVKKRGMEKHYWNGVNKFLNFVSDKIKKEVVIASHHRRNKYDNPSKKKFIFNKTYTLIKESKLVIGHSSTALRLAVLLRKPIIFLNMHLMKLYNYHNFLVIKQSAKELGAQIIYIDENIKFNKNILKKKKLKKISEKKYKKFILVFLASNLTEDGKQF